MPLLTRKRRLHSGCLDPTVLGDTLRKEFAMHRHKMSRGQSRKVFSKFADRTHRFNLPTGKFVMRGGTRL